MSTCRRTSRGILTDYHDANVLEEPLHVEAADAYVEHWDENTGRPLDPERVRAGRIKELAKFREREVYEHIERIAAQHVEGGKFVKTRWVECEKGNEVRCRLVAQEFATGDPRSDLFAGTPPLFAARLLTSLTASRRCRH